MAKKTIKKVDRRMFKKEGEELQQYLAIMRKHGVVENKKGKGSYNRQKEKANRQKEQAKVGAY